MSQQLIPFDDVQRMAKAVAASKLFGMKSHEEAIALMLVAQSEGLHPARAALEYHIINGRPSLKADAMLSRFQNAGGKVDWKTYTDEECTGIFSHPQGGSVTITWTIAMGHKAKLTGNPTWSKFPRAMLRARCISEGIRTVYPGVSVGIYTPEEVSDFTPPEKEINPLPATDMPDTVRQAAGLSPVKAALQGVEVNEEDEAYLRTLADEITVHGDKGEIPQAYDLMENAKLDGDQKIFLWSVLASNSKLRSALKKEGEARKSEAKANSDKPAEEI